MALTHENIQMQATLSVDTNLRTSQECVTNSIKTDENRLSSAAAVAATKPDDEEAVSSMEAPTGLKLKCMIYILLLIFLAFLTTVVETQAFHRRSEDESLVRMPIEWVCYFIKCAIVLPATGALLYLQHSALVPGKVAKVELHVSNSEQSQMLPKLVIILRNVDRFVYLPNHLSKSPSKLFMLTSVLFAFFSCLSILIENSCGIIDLYFASMKSTDLNVQVEVAELLRKLFILIYIVVQTRFFLFNSSVCIQWKLKSVWFSAAHILATNVSTWIINIGFELREVIDVKENEFSTTLYCTNTSVSSYVRALFPFIVEYYVMNALLAVALIANTGRLAIAIRKSPVANLSTEYIAGLLRSKVPGKVRRRFLNAEYAMLKAYSGTVMLGAILVLLTLAVSIFLRKHEIKKRETLVAFHVTMTSLSVFGIVGTAFLLRALKARAPNQHISQVHKMDRMLLWIGASAIALNDAYTFFISCSNTFGNKNETHDHGLEINVMKALTATLNIAQSMFQVYVLECALMRKFFTRGDCPQGNLYGRALLTFLILLNASQWLINTICFNFFFLHHKVKDIALAFSLLAIPLQVFFRFHSIACIHEFKNHCAAEPEDVGIEPDAEKQIFEVEYPQRDKQGSIVAPVSNDK